MKIAKTLKWFESYLPTPRHRNPHFRTVEGKLSTTIPEVTKTNAPLAIIMPRRHPYDGESKYGTSRSVEYRWWKKQLWVPVRLSRFVSIHNKKIRQRPAKVSDIHLGWETHSTKEAAQSHLNDTYKKFILIDGRLHEKIGEPRYVVMTFGLGCNHGIGWGTSISVDHHYNSNISNQRYFQIDQEELANKTGRKIAEERGDTKAFPHFDKRMYERFQILIPKAIRLKPKKEHGEGNSFINKIDGLTKLKNPALAGMFGLLLATKEGD